MTSLFWILLFSPLVGALFNGFRFKTSPSQLSGFAGTFFCFLSFVCGSFFFLFKEGGSQTFFLMEWFHIGGLKIDFQFVLDSLSLIMVLLVTGVGTLIHLYSQKYMEKDKCVTKYFSYLNLFIFNMLILVLSDSLPLLFVGWEGVGLCSYLLIGFWNKEDKNVSAGQSAFIVNRVGDAFFLLGMMLLFSQFETLSFSHLNALFEGKAYSFFHPASLGAFLLFLGATGKSAQGPLYFWLPKAMAGPTPVSALIHGATMVTAGIYLVIRLFQLYSASGDVLIVMGWVGALTAFFSALLASGSWDIKKILAFSTISQLAYMVMALSVKAFSSSLFHLLTHGCFKALLFLCAGSLIHGLSGEQDIRKMGGLKKYFPMTFFAYLVGALCLMGFPPFSGFLSKDEILWSLFLKGEGSLFAVAVLTGLFTVFYVTRLTVLLFFGEERATSKPHESPALMWGPLLFLAALSFFIGGLGVPEVLSEHLPFHWPHFLERELSDFFVTSFKGNHGTEWKLLIGNFVLSLGVMIPTYFYYRSLKKFPARSFKKVVEEEFYVDSFLKGYVYKPFLFCSRVLVEGIEEGVLQKAWVSFSQQLLKMRDQLALLQNGNLSSYILYFTLGLSCLMLLVLVK